MPRISMQQAYDNRDVIAQIYKMLADVADSVAKATEAVAKALEAMETAETAEEAVAGKQDALTEAQLLAVDSGITAAKVAEYDGYRTLPDFSEAAEGDALVIGSGGSPEWEELKAGYEYLGTWTKTLTAKTSYMLDHIGTDFFSVQTDTDYLITFEEPTGNTNVIGIMPCNYPRYPLRHLEINNSMNDRTLNAKVYVKPGSGNVIMIPYGGATFKIENGSGLLGYSGYGYGVECKPGSPMPTVQSGYNGRILVAGNINEASWVKLIPDYSAADAGKVLSVNSSGELEWITPQ